MAAMNPKAGSFVINPRLQRHFSVIGLRMPSDGELSTIYQQILSVHFSKFNSKGQNVATQLLAATIQLHHTMEKNFTASATKFHYVFNLRQIEVCVCVSVQGVAVRFDMRRLL